MNIAMRKLAMLEKCLAEREEKLKFDGYATAPINSHLRTQVKVLMEKVKTI